MAQSHSSTSEVHHLTERWSERTHIERLPDGSNVYPPQGPSIEERRRRRWRWLVLRLPFRRFKTWQWRGDYQPFDPGEPVNREDVTE